MDTTIKVRIARIAYLQTGEATSPGATITVPSEITIVQIEIYRMKEKIDKRQIDFVNR